MSLDKKGFAEIIENAISECRTISINSRTFNANAHLTDETDNVGSKYNRYIEKLTLSKIKRLYSILSAPAYQRIISMDDKEIEEYRNDKLLELSSSINRLMLAIEVCG